MNLCIVLILIVMIIYLLETSSTQSEFMSVSSPESSINSFNNNIGLGVGGSVTVNDKGINPIPTNANNNKSNTDYTFASSFGITPNNVKEMTTPSSQAVDSNIINYYGKQMANDMQQKPFNVKDFLPKEINSEWFQTDLSNAKNELDQSSLIDVSRYCSGIDTVGTSMKNASRDIRGNIANPKMVVSPFLNSSYDPDNNIKSWC